MRKEKSDTAESDMVEHLQSVDTLVHYIASKRISEKRAARMTLKEWDKIYNRLLRFICTPQALQLIEMSKD
jgi:hypothetical protein